MSSFAVDLASQVNIPSFADSVFPKLKCTVHYFSEALLWFVILQDWILLLPAYWEAKLSISSRRRAVLFGSKIIKCCRLFVLASRWFFDLFLHSVGLFSFYWQHLEQAF